MNCKNCGAPMKFVWDREHFYCEYCQTYRFLGEPEAGVKVLGEESSERCPACQENLKIASEFHGLTSAVSTVCPSRQSSRRCAGGARQSHRHPGVPILL